MPSPLLLPISIAGTFTLAVTFDVDVAAAVTEAAINKKNNNQPIHIFLASNYKLDLESIFLSFYQLSSLFFSTLIMT